MKELHDLRGIPRTELNRIIKNAKKQQTTSQKFTINRKLALMILLSLLIPCLVMATVLYSLNVPMNFSVSTEYGLQLYDETQTTVITSISWATFSKGQTQTQNFYVLNNGNLEAKVICDIGVYDTSAWLITSTFTNQTLAKGDFSTLFSISITEIDAVGNQPYSCEIAFKVVDAF